MEEASSQRRGTGQTVLEHERDEKQVDKQLQVEREHDRQEVEGEVCSPSSSEHILVLEA